MIERREIDMHKASYLILSALRGKDLLTYLLDTQKFIFVYFGKRYLLILFKVKYRVAEKFSST